MGCFHVWGSEDAAFSVYWPKFHRSTSKGMVNDNECTYIMRTRLILNKVRGGGQAKKGNDNQRTHLSHYQPL